MPEKDDIVLKIPIPNLDNLEDQRKNTYQALSSRSQQFSEDLIYETERSSNNSLLEGDVEPLKDFNLPVFNHMKDLARQGIYAPIRIYYEPNQGYIIRAESSIPACTLICEYIGQVRKTKRCIFVQNDSIMDLLITGDSSTSLSIIPENYSNIARFFSGVNSTTKEGLAKQNLKCVRVSIKGEVRAIIFTTKSVSKGESLCFNYNEAGLDNYDTSNFV